MLSVAIVVFLFLKYLKSLHASNTVAIRGIFGGGFNLESRNLGQAKLIASFPFQDFQNMMRAGGHYSLFIIAKNLYNPMKIAETSNNEI